MYFPLKILHQSKMYVLFVSFSSESHFNLSGPPASTSSKLLSRIGNVDGQSISSMSSSSSTSSSSTGKKKNHMFDYNLLIIQGVQEGLGAF